MGAVRGSQILYNSSIQFALSIGYGLGVSGTQYQNGVPVGGTSIAWAAGSSSLPVQWGGGRTMLSIDSDGVFPPSAANLQVQVQNQRGNWIQVGSGFFAIGPTAAGMWPIDTVPGQYRVFSNSGLTAGLNIMFTGISYGT